MPRRIITKEAAGQSKSSRPPARAPGLRRVLPDAPAVVAVAHTLPGLRLAANLAPGAVDLVEVRIDALHPRCPRPLLAKIQTPLLLTARHRAEGGMRDWSPGERSRALAKLLPLGAAVDWEWAFRDEGATLIEEARQIGLAIIFSHHDFAGTPPLSRLLHLCKQILASGADACKIAVTLRGPDDLLVLLRLRERLPHAPIALMGMGPMGRASRLLLAASGSALNYGWLHRPLVHGQYPAEILRDRIAEVCG